MKIGIGSPEWIERLKDTTSEIAAVLTRLSHEDRTTPFATYLALVALSKRFEDAAKNVPRKDVDRWLRAIHAGVTWEIAASSPPTSGEPKAPVQMAARYAVIFFRETTEPMPGVPMDIPILREEAYGKAGVPWAWLFGDLQTARAHAEDGGPAGARGKIFEAVSP